MRLVFISSAGNFVGALPERLQMLVDSKLPLNIYSMFIVRELYVKMSVVDFDQLMNSFNNLLCLNKPDEAQVLINNTLEKYGL